MAAQAHLDGLGEVQHDAFTGLHARYRFFSIPSATPAGLAVCEAMMVGLPVVGWRPQRWSRWLKTGFWLRRYRCGEVGGGNASAFE